MVADWSAEVIEAVERWVETKPRPSRNTGGWRRIGLATPDRDGWLVLDLRGNRTNPDALGEPCFAGDRGPDDERSYPVEELRSVDGVLMLREPPGLPARCRHVWARTMSARFLLDKLLDGLRAAGPAHLAHALAEKRLSGPPTSSADAVGLVGAQVEAFRACLSPGVRLVWGPPGTGKTQVLARAIEELVRSGKRVLLVSTANVAVDNALHAVVSRLPRRPGVAIRVGTAHVKEIATDANVQLERLAAAASADADQQRDRVARQLREFDDADAKIESLREELLGYDDEAYRAAVARVDAERTVEELRPRIREAESAVDTAREADVSARAVLHETEVAQAELGPARRALAHHAGAAEELATLDRNQRALQLEHDALDLTVPPAGWLARRRHRRELDLAASEVRRFAAEAAQHRRSLLALQVQAQMIIGASTRADLDDADLRAAEAQAAAVAAGKELRRAQSELDGLHRIDADAQSHDSPNDDDRRLVARSVQHDLPARHARLHDLLTKQRRAAGRRSELEALHRALVGRARKLRADAESEIVREARVVATTLARSRVHRAIAAATFDVVLVDEAGAATLAEVLLALRRAKTTAVLFGDFLQLAPVIEGVEDDPHPALEKWVRATCFSHVRINTPSDIGSNGRCVVLTHQFRFGPELRRLANNVIYDVLRDASELRNVHVQPRTEIVLVDVSTVPNSPMCAPAAEASGGPRGPCCPGCWRSCTWWTRRSASSPRTGPSPRRRSPP